MPVLYPVATYLLFAPKAQFLKSRLLDIEYKELWKDAWSRSQRKMACFKNARKPWGRGVDRVAKKVILLLLENSI